jgi:hypothetical protein
MDNESGRKANGTGNDVSGENSFSGRQEASEDALKREDFFTGLSFSTLILSLSTSVLVNLGELPDPLSNEKEVNLPLAKQSISIIEMLKEKTKGNLTQDEERLIGNMLYDLRMKYVAAASA